MYGNITSEEIELILRYAEANVLKIAILYGSNLLGQVFEGIKVPVISISNHSRKVRRTICKEWKNCSKYVYITKGKIYMW